MNDQPQPIPEQRVDLVVIGSGPGGEGAAMQAAKAGQRVAVVERYSQVGGGCTHWGTVPSKALRQAIQELTNFRRNPLFRDAIGHVQLAFPDLLRGAASVIARQVDLRQSFYDRNHVQLVHGQARFVGPHAIEVEEPGGGRARYHAAHVVIATGSRPYHPPEVDFTHPRVFDSDTVLKLDFTPTSLCIYGAGVIGCEYASLFRNFGVKVNLLNTRPQLLTYLDDEIVDALAYQLREQGVLIRHGEELSRIEYADAKGVVVELQSGKRIKTDALLWTNGRTGNTDGLGLDAIGLKVDSRGNLPVNASMQTALDHIYAVGDVAGPPALASVAYDQGRYAVRHLLGHPSARMPVELLPTGIFTSPEISCVGQTERELTAAKVPYEVGHAFFKSLARAQITGETVGMLKLLFHRDTRALLGVHCFGAQAAEIVHIGQAVMAQPAPHNSIDFFVDTTFNYPTMAEAYRVAALNGLNRLF